MSSVAMPDKYLDGTYLINLDWEWLGSLCNSAAGGDFLSFTRKAEWVDADANSRALRLSLKGLQGGHSGVGINLGRANALVCMATILSRLTENGVPVHIADFHGGQAKNAIPAQAERLLEHVLPYAFVIFLGSIPMSFKLFFEYLVRTDAKPQVGLLMSLTGLVLNVVFDYILVAVFKMGTLGAALGTLLSITVSMLIGLGYFLRHGHIRFCKPKANWAVLVKSCTNGSSEMLTEMSTGITTFLFNIIIMKYHGEDGVAAVTIIMYIYYFFISFYMGIAVAAAPIVSFNVGARNYEKIHETTRYSFITIAITSVLILAVSLLLGQQIIHLFVGGGHVFDLTWEGLKLFCPVFLFIGLNVFLSGYFTALGNGFISALISTLRSLILVVVFILILPRIIDVDGIWLTMPLSEAVTIFVAVSLYRTHGKRFLQKTA